MTPPPDRARPLWADRYLTGDRLVIARGPETPRPQPPARDWVKAAGLAWRQMSRGQKWAVGFGALLVASLISSPLRPLSEDLATAAALGILAALGVLLLVGLSRAETPPAPPAPPPLRPEQILAAADSTEARVAGAASRAWQETLREPSWRSPYLATTRAAFDGQAEVDQIIDIALRIHGARTRLGARPDGPAAEFWTRQYEALEQAAHQLGRRADALVRHRDQAAHLSEELRHLADLERLERSAVEIDGLTIETAYPSGRRDGRLTQLSEEMAAVRQAMTELVELMTRTRAPLAEPPDGSHVL